MEKEWLVFTVNHMLDPQLVKKDVEELVLALHDVQVLRRFGFSSLEWQKLIESVRRVDHKLGDVDTSIKQLLDAALIENDRPDTQQIHQAFVVDDDDDVQRTSGDEWRAASIGKTGRGQLVQPKNVDAVGLVQERNNNNGMHPTVNVEDGQQQQMVMM